MLRLMRDFLTAEYALTPAMSGLPASVSPRTIDRILKPVKDKGRLRGLSLTKGGTLLRDQIPVRVMFTWDERKPGFFEFDRAARCGAEASCQFCQTLTGTDAGSGRTGEHALLNSARRADHRSEVKERIQQLRNELPFPLLGVDSDNGGGFIKRGTFALPGSVEEQPPPQRPVRPEPHPVHPGPSLPEKRQLLADLWSEWSRNRKLCFRRRCGA